MNQLQDNPALDTRNAAADALEADRHAQIETFVRTNPEYYSKQFDKISKESKFTPTFNPMAGLFGPIWFGARGLWNWAVAFLILEAIGFVRIALGLFGDLAAEARERIASIEGTLELRRQQLKSAVESGSDKEDVYRRTVESLEKAIGGIREEATQLQENGIWIALSGLALLIVVKIIQSVMANTILEGRFSDWMSDNSIRHGMPMRDIVLSTVFMVLIVCAAMLHYSFPGSYSLLSQFPTDPEIRLEAIKWVEDFFTFAVTNGDALFDSITYCIRLLLDALEIIFVQTPWIVVASFIILLTWLSAGPSIAWNGCLPFDYDWYSARYVLRETSASLCGRTADHGFHADHAGLCLHDSGHCILWHRQTCRRCYHDDFRRNPCRSPDCPGSPRGA
jgi:glycine betaine/proline transport system permease protein